MDRAQRRVNKKLAAKRQVNFHVAGGGARGRTVRRRHPEILEEDLGHRRQREKFHFLQADQDLEDMEQEEEERLLKEEMRRLFDECWTDE
jgi:hypothetical protein